MPGTTQARLDGDTTQARLDGGAGALKSTLRLPAAAEGASAPLSSRSRTNPTLFVGWSCLGRTRVLRELIGWSGIPRTRPVGGRPTPRPTIRDVQTQRDDAAAAGR